MLNCKYRQFIDGRFEYFGFFKDEGAKHYSFRSPNQLNLNRYPMDQYTGLKDKNGKEIYAGDIDNTDDEPMIVVWDEKNACFGLSYPSDISHIDSCILWEESNIVGNIHEGSHLLSGN